MSEARDCCSDAAAFLLGALEPAEAERFRDHAEHCVVCRDELGSLRHVVDALPLAAPRHRAPTALRRRVMREVRSERALTAQTARQRLLFLPGPRRAVPHTVLAVALAAVVALAIGGGVELAGSGSGAARVIRASVTGVPGSAQLRIHGERAELVVSHLPPPPPGHIYEVWIERGDQAPSPTNALFGVTGSGRADVGVPGSLRGVTAILVTPEPAGGSLAPTHAPVIVTRLA